jgi:hypothetical protein
VRIRIIIWRSRRQRDESGRREGAGGEKEEGI